VSGMQRDNPPMPPFTVLEALRRPRRPYCPPPETERARPTPLQKALGVAEVFPKGQHMPPSFVLGALYWRVVRLCSPANSPANTKRSYSPLGLHLAARRAREDRARRVLVRRRRRVLVLLPEELGPDDEVLADDDPYFRKKGRPRAVVQAWKEKPPTWTID
jgi:hypothetical protein